MTLRLGQEITPAEKWLDTTLRANATLNTGVSGRMSGYNSPQGTGYPAVVWQLQAPSTDVKAIGNIRIMVRPIYVVRVVGQTASMLSLSALADEIDESLEGASGTVDLGGGREAEILECTRVGPFALAEAVNGVQYRHLGGQYRIAVQLTSG